MKGGKLLDPEWRRQRAQKAGLASRKARRRRALAASRDLPDKRTAYARGYRTGYQCAYHLWRAWAERQLRRAGLAA